MIKMSLYNYACSFGRKLLNLRVNIKCKYCGQRGSYKIQFPVCNPIVVASLSNNVNIIGTETIIIFNNITANETCYNSCNNCHQSPCCCPSRSSSGCYDSDSDSDSCSCDRSCGGKKCRKGRRRNRNCGYQQCNPYAPSPCATSPCAPSPCAPSSYGPYPNYCPNPIAPNYCPNPMYPWCFYDANNGTATVPRCGTGTYLITATFLLSTSTAGTTPIEVVGNIHINNGGLISQKFSADPNVETTFHMVHRAHLIEGTQFTIGMIAPSLNPGDTVSLRGNGASQIHIVKLF